MQITPLLPWIYTYTTSSLKTKITHHYWRCKTGLKLEWNVTYSSNTPIIYLDLEGNLQPTSVTGLKQEWNVSHSSNTPIMYLVLWT